MASIINANTSAGLISTGDTSGVLQLQTGGTAAVTIDASQNVGVGTVAPSTRLHANLASNNATSYPVYVDNQGNSGRSEEHTSELQSH